MKPTDDMVGLVVSGIRGCAVSILANLQEKTLAGQVTSEQYEKLARVYEELLPLTEEMVHGFKKAPEPPRVYDKIQFLKDHAKQTGIKNPVALVASLVGYPYPEDEQKYKALVSFRHLRSDARIAAAKRALRA